MLHKRYQFDSTEIMHRAEELVSAASNRYRITVQVANRAKRRRYEDFENLDDPMMKPVIRAIIEMSEELTQPEIIGEDFTQFEGQKPEPEPLRSSSSTSESRKNEQTNNLLKMLARVRKEAENKAAQDIQAILKFAKASKRALENKAAQDIQAVAQFFEDTKRQAEQNIQAAARSVGDTHQQVSHYLDQAAQGTGQVVTPLQKTLTEFWNRYWLERLLDLITGFDLDKAKNDVKKLQQDYPHFQPGQIADHCMQEKILWATATGLIGGIVPGVGLAVDFLKTSPLLVEMVYQIAVAYGFEDLKDSARKGELLAVFGLALGKDKIVHLGLGFLLKQAPIPSWAIDASTNVLMFQIVGYTASEFYEAKVKSRVNPLNSVDAFTVLEEEVKAYAEEVISEKKKIAHVVAEAISIKDQLA